MASPSHRDVLRGGFWIDVANRSDADLLRPLVVVAGLSWSVAFIVIGLGYQLELFGDGSIFFLRRRGRRRMGNPLA